MSLFALPSWRQIGIFTDDDMSESDSYTGYQSSLSTVTTPQLATWSTFEYMNNKVTLATQHFSSCTSDPSLFVFIWIITDVKRGDQRRSNSNDKTNPGWSSRLEEQESRDWPLPHVWGWVSVRSVQVYKTTFYFYILCSTCSMWNETYVSWGERSLIWNKKSEIEFFINIHYVKRREAKRLGESVQRILYSSHAGQCIGVLPILFKWNVPS